jgi:hypothetical protein
MASSKGTARGAGMDQFHVQVFFAGREGVQEEYDSQKRRSIRKMKDLLKSAPFGSSGSVRMVQGKRRILIAQAHVAYRKNGSLIVKMDEL